MEKETASLIERIARMPGMENVPREEIEATVKEVEEKMSLKPEEIIEVVVSKLGKQRSESQAVLLCNLKPGMRNVSVKGKIVFVSEGSVHRKDGETKNVLKGLITDNTKKLNFVVWNPEKYGDIVVKGAVLSFKNIYTTEWQGEPQINTSESTVIEQVSEAELPKFRLGVEMKIKDIANTNSAVSFIARVLSLKKKVLDARGEKVLYEGWLADETGQIQFTAWKDFGLKENDVVKVSGAYKKIWKDRHSIVMDEKTVVEHADDGLLPPKENLVAPKEVLLEEVEEGQSLRNVQIEGFLIEVKERSGLVYRCPECDIVLNEGVCKEHGKVKGIADLRIKGVIDDGTGAIIALFPKAVCEKLLGKSLEDYISLVGKDGVINPALLEIKERLLGRALQLIGNVSPGDFGTTFIVQDAQRLELDWKLQAKALLSEMEV